MSERKMFSGLNGGEHANAYEDLLSLEGLLEKGTVNSFSFRLRRIEYSEEMFYEVARFAVKHKAHFFFLYAYQFPPEGKESHLNECIVSKVKEIAGEYFLGEIFGEAGSDKAAKAKGYFKEDPDCLATVMPPQTFQSMADGKENYLRFIRKMVEYDKKVGVPATALVDATALSKYNLEAGVDMPILEVMPGDVEQLVAFTRGAAVGYARKSWGGFIANEWYGGYDHGDELKAKRLLLTYRLLYLSGADTLFLESGYNSIESFGYHYGYDHPFCERYRAAMEDFHALTLRQKRLGKGPKTKVAFLHGNLDAYTGFMGSSIWSQFDKEEWGMSAPEFSWRILDEVYRGCAWQDGANFGDNGEDYSRAPAYGQYDVVPVESKIEVLSRYDLLIFAGWNTMTEELYEKLKAYVAGGGKLIMSVAHLNGSAVRGAHTYILDGKYEDFLGFNIVGKNRTNDGVKFRRNGAGNTRYAGTLDYVCDCNYCGGYVDYAEVALKGGEVVAFFDNKFSPAPADIQRERAALIERKYGKGVVSVFTHTDYPGRLGVFPLYRAVVKENLTATHRECPLQVLASDRVRFALYEGEQGEERLFLLNTDYNAKQFVTVRYRGEEREVLVEAGELVCVDY